MKIPKEEEGEKGTSNIWGNNDWGIPRKLMSNTKPQVPEGDQHQAGYMLKAATPRHIYYSNFRKSNTKKNLEKKAKGGGNLT